MAILAVVGSSQTHSEPAQVYLDTPTTLCQRFVSMHVSQDFALDWEDRVTRHIITDTKVQ